MRHTKFYIGMCGVLFTTVIIYTTCFNILLRVCGDYIRWVLDWQLDLLDQQSVTHLITESLTITTDSHNWVTTPAESLQGPGPPADPTGTHWPSTNSSWLISATHCQLTCNWNCPCNCLTVKVKVTLRPTISRSVCPGFEPHVGLVTGH
jgi:hypothetical protein